MDTDEAAYLGPLLTRLAPVARLVRAPGRGRGLVATAPARKGDVLWVEEPLASLQHHANRDIVAACDHCAKFVGTLGDQIGLLVRVRVAREAAEGGDDTAVDALASELAAAFPALPAGWAPPGIDADAATLAPALPCPWGCGAAWCGAACRDRALGSYHVVLCPVGPGGAQHAHTGAGTGADEDEESADADVDVDVDVDGGGGADDSGDEGSDGGGGVAVSPGVLFEHQALATNEGVLLAARLLCRALELCVRNGGDAAAALRPLAVLHAPAVGTERSARRAAQVAEWAADSLTILRALVRERAPAFVAAVRGAGAGAGAGSLAGASPSPLTDAALDVLLGPAVWGRLLRALDANCIEVKVDSPLRDYVGVLRATAEGAAGRGGGGGGATASRAATAAAAAALRELDPVLAQVAAARDARRNVRRRLRASARGGDDGGYGDDDDDDGEGGDGDGDAVMEGAAAAGGGSGGGDSEDDGSDSGSESEGSEDAYEGAPPSSGDEEGGGGMAPAGASAAAALFPHCNGIALFSLGCLMNHACAPNVQLVYGGSHVAAAVARRDVAAGDELCVNYVDVRRPVAARRAELLAGYGFACDCARCVQQLGAPPAGVGAGAQH